MHTLWSLFASARLTPSCFALFKRASHSGGNLCKEAHVSALCNFKLLQSQGILVYPIMLSLAITKQSTARRIVGGSSELSDRGVKVSQTEDG